MSSVYKVTIMSEQLEIAICKHGSSFGNTMRPHDMIRCILNALETIHSVAGIPYVLSDIYIKMVQILNVSDATKAIIEKQLIENRRKLIADFPEDSRLFDYFVDECGISTWDAHLHLVNINKMLDNSNGQFFMTNDYELTLIDQFDNALMETHILAGESEIVDDIELTALEYFAEP